MICLVFSYVSQFTVETSCFADGRCFSSKHGVLCMIGSSCMRRYQKKLRSVCPSRCSFFIVSNWTIFAYQIKWLDTFCKKLKRYLWFTEISLRNIAFHGVIVFSTVLCSLSSENVPWRLGEPFIHLFVYYIC